MSPEEAKRLNVTAPGSALVGRSRWTPTFSAGPRLPTVFSPWHAGVVFDVQTLQSGSASAETNLFWRNVTLALPGQTFANLSVADWFRIDSLSRVCFGNACAPPAPNLRACPMNAAARSDLATAR